MNHKYTGKQVIKAGEVLLDDDIEKFETAMDILSYWRFSHETPLGEALKILQETTLKIDKSAIFAKRLKRYPSIVNKLRRFKKMKLKNMQDIGGCRAIVSSPKKLTKIVRELRKMPEFKNSEGKIRYKNYIEHPKEDGYRGYHLVGQFKDEYGELKDIEVQLRTNLQHDWATAVEIVDLFTGQALKSNQGDKEWKDFFSSVSEQFAFMENIHLFNTFDGNKKHKEYTINLQENHKVKESRAYIQSDIKKLNVISKFEAFAHSLRIVDETIEKNSADGYVLVEVKIEDATATVKTIFFNQENNKDAEKLYIETEKKSAGKSNVVVALVSTTAVGGIKEAYPNYFADSTEFLKHLMFVTTEPVQKKQSFISGLFNT